MRQTIMAQQQRQLDARLSPPKKAMSKFGDSNRAFAHAFYPSNENLQIDTSPGKARRSNFDSEGFNQTTNGFNTIQHGEMLAARKNSLLDRRNTADYQMNIVQHGSNTLTHAAQHYIKEK